MFGKKCPRCGKKLSKQKVWHAKSGTFEVETTCYCPSTKVDPNTLKKNQDNTITTRYKTTGELEKEQRERQTARIEEDEIYEEFIKNEKIRIEEEKRALEQDTRIDRQSYDEISKEEERQELSSKSLVPDKILESTKADIGIYGNCAKNRCNEKLRGLNSKPCKLCEQQVCLKHLQPEKHDCPKVIYVPYIRKTWLRKHDPPNRFLPSDRIRMKRIWTRIKSIDSEIRNDLMQSLNYFTSNS